MNPRPSACQANSQPTELIGLSPISWAVAGWLSGLGLHSPPRSLKRVLALDISHRGPPYAVNLMPPHEDRRFGPCSQRQNVAVYSLAGTHLRRKVGSNPLPPTRQSNTQSAELIGLSPISWAVVAGYLARGYIHPLVLWSASSRFTLLTADPRTRCPSCPSRKDTRSASCRLRQNVVMYSGNGTLRR